jgi:Periplasmic component of the Tol biopolymer transport system
MGEYRRFRSLIVAPCLAALLGTGTSCTGFDERSAVPAGIPPTIRPDYSNSVIPPNIAPLNFTITDAGERFAVVISSLKGPNISLVSASPEITIPPGRWRRLLEQNTGNELSFHIYIRRNGRWYSFSPITNKIAAERIDRYITYRKSYPQFYMKDRLEIRQRDLESFDEELILSPKQGCFNCHTFYRHSTDKFLFQARFYGKNYVLLHDQGKTSLITPVLRRPGSSYASWHPDGNLIAFATDAKVSVSMFAAGEGAEEVLEYTDLDGDIAVYNIQRNTMSTTEAISQKDRVENQPAWSPDGQFLYFLSAPKVSKEDFVKVQYDLRRIGYDAGRDTWGEVETLVSARETGLGSTFPAPSPDGKYLLFCMTDRGSFSIVRQSTDLYLMDLEKKSSRRLEINSDHSDSYHAWSSNSRWIVFTSKRSDGIFGRLFFSYFDSNGIAHKPIVLPQQDPRFYESFTKSFQRAEFTTAPFRVSPTDLNEVIGDIGKIITASYEGEKQ